MSTTWLAWMRVNAGISSSSSNGKLRAIWTVRRSRKLFVNLQVRFVVSFLLCISRVRRAGSLPVFTKLAAYLQKKASFLTRLLLKWALFVIAVWQPPTPKVTSFVVCLHGGMSAKGQSNVRSSKHASKSLGWYRHRWNRTGSVKRSKLPIGLRSESITGQKYYF